MSDITDYQTLLDNLYEDPAYKILQETQEHYDLIARKIEEINRLEQVVSKLDTSQLISSINYVDEISQTLDDIFNQTLFFDDVIENQFILEELLCSSKNLLNFTSICEQFCVNGLEQFFSAYEEFMRIMDLPVSNHKITKEQLTNKIKQMDEETVSSAESVAISMINSSPIAQKKKSILLCLLKGLSINMILPITVNIVSNFTYDYIKSKIHKDGNTQQESQCANEHINITINNYNIVFNNSCSENYSNTNVIDQAIVDKQQETTIIQNDMDAEIESSTTSSCDNSDDKRCKSCTETTCDKSPHY